MQKRVFEGSVDYIQVLDENGNLDAALFPKDMTDQQLIDMYKFMSLARAMDAKALSLQRQGRIATYAPLVGQEATQIGCAMAMGKDDWFVPNFRQHGVYMVRGAPMSAVFIGFAGYEEANVGLKAINCLPMCIPVGTQMPHAAGFAFAQKLQKKPGNVVVFIGDGGTSEGDFYEALNFAGVFKAPMLTIIENNQWAISVPRVRQSAAPTLAQKAIGAGIPCMQVDGNDVLAVYKTVKDSLAWIAQGNGPMVIECLTYRMGLHTTADDPTKYRNDADVETWKAKDPITRMAGYLAKKGLWDAQKETDMQTNNLKIIDAEVEKMEQFKADPKSIFKHIYSTMPEVLQEEFDESVQNNFYQGQDKKGTATTQ